jgi:hypothetical protein
MIWQVTNLSTLYTGKFFVLKNLLLFCALSQRASVASYSYAVESYKCCGGKGCLHLPRTKAALYSETLVTFYQTTKRNAHSCIINTTIYFNTIFCIPHRTETIVKT